MRWMLLVVVAGCACTGRDGEQGGVSPEHLDGSLTGTEGGLSLTLACDGDATSIQVTQGNAYVNAAFEGFGTQVVDADGLIGPQADLEVGQAEARLEDEDGGVRSGNLIPRLTDGSGLTGIEVEFVGYCGQTLSTE